MTEAATEFDAAAARLSEHTARAVPWLFEVRGVDDFVNVGRAQVPPAVDMVATILRAYAEDVISGNAPATLPMAGHCADGDVFWRLISMMVIHRRRFSGRLVLHQRKNGV
jgi:hypothetical protein